MRKEWIDKAIFFILLVCVVVAVQYFYNEKYRECTGNPLVYSAKYYEERYDNRFEGTATFVDVPNAPIIKFNSDNISVLQLNVSNIYINVSG
jgi:hypothetical protein